MKSQAKVKQQRRIKSIPILAHGFKMMGIMRPGISDTESNRHRRAKSKIQRMNRRMNRTSV